MVFAALYASPLAAVELEGPVRNSLFGKDSLQGIYVRDSAIAVEKIAHAERLERLKEWAKAAEIYQEIIEQYPDRVVPSRVNDENQIVQYTSVVSAVQERLAKWPADGLTAYRNRYEVAARAILDDVSPSESTDKEALHRVAKLYFVTDTARDAAQRLIDLQLQNGDFAAAAWLGDRLLQWHPGIDAMRAQLLFRTAIAYRLLGNDETAAARGDELAREHPDATGLVRGGQMKLADALAEALTAEISIQSLATDSWPTAFGNNSRDRVPAAITGIGARLFSVPIVRAAPRLPAGQRAPADMDRDQRQAGFATGILPVIDRGELFFQDNQRIYGLSLDSGLPLAGWAETYAGDRAGRYSIADAFPTPLGAQLAVTVTDDTVLSVLGQNDLRAMLYSGNLGASRESRLVCLDRRTGAERWSFASRSLNQRDERTPGRGMELQGTPVVAGDRVFITAQSASGVQFQKCELIALDRHTGTLQWRIYIASASVNSQIWDVESTLQDQQTPQLSFADGRLYVCTNLGATAAIDATDGTIIWLNLYPREATAQSRLQQLRRPMASGMNVSRKPRPWAHNPVIVSGNRVFTLPRNSEFAFINDASTGAEISRIPVQPFDSADTLIGVTGERLLLAGLKSVYCLNWGKFQADAPVGAYLQWSSIFKRGGFDDASLRGRPFLTHDSVYVPTAWQMSRIALGNGKAISSYPGEGREWSEEESAGNLLVLQDHLVIAGPEQVAVYTDLNVAMQKLDAESQRDPSSPKPRLRYAEVMFVAGRFDLAAAKLDEARDLLTAAGALQPGPDRNRLFNSSLNFAKKLTSQPREEASIRGFFDRAAVAAASPQQNVAFRIAKARWLNQQKDDAGELTLYQQILADPAMRLELISGADGGPVTQAAYIAERAVGEIIMRNPAVYAPIEQAAQAEFDAVANDNDPEKLLAIAQTYPNSKISAAALFASAGIYEHRGDYRQSVMILRSLLPRNLSNNDRLLCMETLARNYLMLPNRLDVAISRLYQASQLSPTARLSKPIQLPGGQTLDNATFAEAALAIKQLRREVSRERLTRIALPSGDAPPDETPPAFVQAMEPIDGVTRLLRPPTEGARHDRLVAYMPDKGVRVFQIVDGIAKPIFASQTTSMPTGCTWVGQSLLYWTANRVVFVKGDDSGLPMWEISLGNLPQVELSAAGEEEIASSNQDLTEAGEQAQSERFNNPDFGGVNARRVVVRQGGQIIVRNGNAVRVFRPNQPNNAPGETDERIVQVRALSDRVIVSTNQGRILALDLADGNCLWQVRPSDRAIDRLLATDDFVATLFFDDSSAQIVAIDATTGQFAFRRVFSRDAGVVNFCLAPDGKLLWLRPEALFAKDLFDPSDRPTYSRSMRPPDGGPVFGMEMRLLDQMLVVDDKVLILADGGQHVRAFSLDDGRPISQKTTDGNLTIEQRFRTGSGDWNAKLAVFGRRLYCMGVLGEMISHDLETSDYVVLNVRRIDSPLKWAGREMIATTTHILRIEEPTNAGAGRRRDAVAATPNAGLSIAAFRRALTDGGTESGKLDHLFQVAGNIVNEQWQPVDGGLAYLTADRKLHILRGNGK